MTITDEQAIAVWQAMDKARAKIAAATWDGKDAARWDQDKWDARMRVCASTAGRAAIDACAPILLGAATFDEFASVQHANIGLDGCTVCSTSKVEVDKCNDLMRNRLRSLTAKPDARVDLVRNLMRDESVKAGTLNDIAVKIVAALDKEAAK